jgi:hypothetical protein
VRLRFAIVAVVHACSFSSRNDHRPVDAPGDVADASSDAAIDAAAIDAAIDANATCSLSGLQCPAGSIAKLVPAACSDRAAYSCWVGCRDGGLFTWTEAEAACVAWGGHLGWFDSANEETCVRNTINGAIWLGIQQLGNQSQTNTGWIVIAKGTAGSPTTSTWWRTAPSNARSRRCRSRRRAGTTSCARPACCHA